MAKRVSPTLSEYQTKILTVMAYREGCNLSQILRKGAVEMISKLSDVEIRAMILQYDKMSPEQRKKPQL